MSGIGGKLKREWLTIRTVGRILRGTKGRARMIDNLFTMMGGLGTAGLLVAILAFLGTPAIGAVACPTNALRRLQPRGR